MDRILVIDDEPDLLETCREMLREQGYEVATELTARAGIAALESSSFALVLIDLNLPDLDGLAALGEIRKRDADVATIVITGFPTIETAVEAVRQGASDYLPKPFSGAQLATIVSRALEQKRLAEENRALRRTLNTTTGLEGMVATSAAMLDLIDLIRKVAESDMSVVIEGETGTGKELVARSIHHHSSRSERPLVPINCGALPEQLLESELFGHERGAFTGAHTRKRGLLENVNGGVLFLDEVTTLSPDLQVKLLRVLEERTVRRVGGREAVPIDMRILTATNEPLEEAMSQGRFRRDLYYRLNVITISIPPLRVRLEDIPPLVAHFLEDLNRQQNKKIGRITQEMLDLLQQYPWPGNVRELRNTIERGFFLTDRDYLDVADLPPHFRDADAKPIPVDANLSFAEAKRRHTAPFEYQYLTKLLQRFGGNVTKAAARAGMHRSSFQRLLRRHRIDAHTFRGE